MPLPWAPNLQERLGWRSLLCVLLLGAEDPSSSVSPRPPAPPLSVSSPSRSSACQLGDRWFAPRGARRRGEGRQPPPPCGAGAQASRGPKATGYVGRTASPGRLRCAPAVGGHGQKLHWEKATRPLRDGEVSAPVLCPALTPREEPRSRRRSGAGFSSWGSDKNPKSCRLCTPGSS